MKRYDTVGSFFLTPQRFVAAWLASRGDGAAATASASASASASSSKIKNGSDGSEASSGAACGPLSDQRYALPLPVWQMVLGFLALVPRELVAPFLTCTTLAKVVLALQDEVVPSVDLSTTALVRNSLNTRIEYDGCRRGIEIAEAEIDRLEEEMKSGASIDDDAKTVAALQKWVGHMEVTREAAETRTASVLSEDEVTRVAAVIAKGRYSDASGVDGEFNPAESPFGYFKATDPKMIKVAKLTAPAIARLPKQLAGFDEIVRKTLLYGPTQMVFRMREHSLGRPFNIYIKRNESGKNEVTLETQRHSMASFTPYLLYICARILAPLGYRMDGQMAFASQYLSHLGVTTVEDNVLEVHSIFEPEEFDPPISFALYNAASRMGVLPLYFEHKYDSEIYVPGLSELDCDVLHAQHCIRISSLEYRDAFYARFGPTYHNLETDEWWISPDADYWEQQLGISKRCIEPRFRLTPLTDKETSTQERIDKRRACRLKEASELLAMIMEDERLLQTHQLRVPIAMPVAMP